MSSSWLKIWTADYSKEGYETGLDDVKRDQPKKAWGFFGAASSINYVWRFDNAYNSYAKSYDRGFNDGQRVVNEVYQQQSSGGHSKMSMDSYANHARMVDEAKIVIESLRPYLFSIEEKYAQQIASMEAAGFVAEYIEPLRNRQQQFKQRAHTLIETIERNGQQLEHQRGILGRLAEDARSGQ